MKKYNGINYSVGRKIPPEFENPIDDVLLDICDQLVPYCDKIKLTPNFITIFRTILGIITLYLFNFTSDFVFPITGTIIFYLLDCLDGHLARSTNQVTILGDYLDHYSDISYYLILILIMINKTYSNKIWLLSIIFLFTYMSFIHLGLQQKVYKKIKKDIREENKVTEEHKMIIVDEIDEELLDSLNLIHSLSEDNIKWTKYLGTGTLYTVLLIGIYYIQTHG